MKTLTHVVVSILMLPSLLACTQDSPDKQARDIVMSAKSAQVILADNQFGLELFGRIADLAEPVENIFLSPFSISQALAMTCNGADGETRRQMEAVLRKQNLSSQDLNETYHTLVKALGSHDPKVKLQIANALFYDQNLAVKSDFIQTNQHYYDAAIQKLDFGAQQQTLNTVNSWVKNKTNQKIDKILDQVNAEDAMYLINAIYFNGNWTYQFDKNATTDRPFHLEDGTTIQVPTMTTEAPFRYFGNSALEIIELPYGNKKFSMLIALPSVETGTKLLKNQLTAENLQQWMAGMTEVKKKVFLPKFEFSWEKTLNDDLIAMGMPDAFDEGKANFSGINEELRLFISEVKHKSYIKVDEEGTEAAAVTSVTVGVTSVGPDLSFRADRPFFFLIREKDTNAILFIGRMSNPLEN